MDSLKKDVTELTTSINNVRETISSYYELMVEIKQALEELNRSNDRLIERMDANDENERSGF